MAFKTTIWLGLFIIGAQALGFGQELGSFLAINSLGLVEEDGKIIQRRLEINWFGILPHEQESIEAQLFDQEPDGITELVPILRVPIVEQSEDHYVTNIMLSHRPSDQMGFASQCVFPYWVQLRNLSSGIELAPSRCLRGQPTWMWDHRNDLEHLAIGDLMLIAAHDAASYRDFDGNNQLEDFVGDQICTQEESLLQQLQWGVRFLDIRVGHYPEFETQKFWLVHDIALVRGLQEGLDQVQEFLRNSPDIVIWDSHSFVREWDSSTHEEYIRILKDTFGPWWVKPNGKAWDLALEDIWNQPDLVPNEGRIIFIHEDVPNSDPDWFFPNIPEFWGDKDEIEELKVYLDSVIEIVEESTSDRYYPWRPNCQLTSSFSDILTQKYSGLREMADLTNRRMTNWWRTDFQNLTHVFSLHDFVLGTDMIQIAIERNLRLAKGIY